jgi:hypothetical protein
MSQEIRKCLSLIPPGLYVIDMGNLADTSLVPCAQHGFPGGPDHIDDLCRDRPYPVSRWIDTESGRIGVHLI